LATAKKVYHAVGKRKTAIARAYLNEGSGEIAINNKPAQQYFNEVFLSNLAKPFKVIEKDQNGFSMNINVHGGGPSAQSEACMYAISKALTVLDPGLRGDLKKAQLLTRDARVVERKKYGHKKARKSFQFSKR